MSGTYWYFSLMSEWDTVSKSEKKTLKSKCRNWISARILRFVEIFFNEVSQGTLDIYILDFRFFSEMGVKFLAWN